MTNNMTDTQPARRFRFGIFEADAHLGELRRQGVRIKLHAQPFQVLLMLLDRPGEVLTREEIAHKLWPDGTFVDSEHGVNSAINRIREALGDKAKGSRFVETLARRGYRFVAPVDQILYDDSDQNIEPTLDATKQQTAIPEETESSIGSRILASPKELPKTPYPVVQALFVLLQLMYLGFYFGALANLAEIEELFSVLPKSSVILNILTVTAAILIPVRIFLLCAVLFHAPRVREKILKLWPFLLAADELWSLAPFLLLHHINYGLALACTTILIYSPFAQRSLVLMGAGRWDHLNSALAD